MAEYSPSVTRWQAERDGLLDEISFLRGKLKSTTQMVEDLIVSYDGRYELDGEAVVFDLTEVMMVLVESKPVLVSNVPETKEETQ